MIFVLYTFCGETREKQHSAAYSLLSLYLGYRPEISREETGRPYVVAGPRFSISHTGGLAACSVSESALSGVDVERIGRAISKRVSDRMLCGLSGREAVKKWTETEALGKYIGCGVLGLKNAETPDCISFTTVEKNGFYITVCAPEEQDVSFIEVK
ncbi:MAG: hypothetical protein J5563_03480 [Clostridia bacterium]|nr:hypothetical protein [Clostridia bacterium]